MAWTVERWLADVFPGEENIYSEYRELHPRELTIVAVAVLDSALAEILTLRLKEDDKETASFLGLNGDGRAPVASFGARIQLALLTGILTDRDATILRTLKGIRNAFAHRVNVDFLSPIVLSKTEKLLSLWVEFSEQLSGTGVFSGSSEHLDVIKQHLPSHGEAGEGLLLAVFSVYQAYFHRMHSRVERVGNAIAVTVGDGRDHARSSQ